jgi:hypothetical protein
VHEKKRFVIAAAIIALGLASSVSAQKDAAEKEKEGGIEHWIEYYKGEAQGRRNNSAGVRDLICLSSRARRADRARRVTSGKNRRQIKEVRMAHLRDARGPKKGETGL